ncbi:hypothetical protein [Moraxella lacunata]|uniref:hypothetical protein n=1 Tax=Moraxella lacunata TaxID=477 RepID=UPI003EDF88EE
MMTVSTPKATVFRRAIFWISVTTPSRLMADTAGSSVNFNVQKTAKNAIIAMTATIQNRVNLLAFLDFGVDMLMCLLKIGWSKMKEKD